MNKKKLSVVMAGAMLATSVAPVLAAETTAKEYTVSQKKLLANELETLMKSKMISTNGALLVKKASERFVKTDVADLMVADRSAYGIKVLNKEGVAVDLNSTFSISSADADKITYSIADMKTVINHNDFKAGYTVQVIERKTNEFYGENIPGSAITLGDATVDKYTEKDLSTDGSAINSDLLNEIKLNDTTDKSKLVDISNVAYDADKKEVKIPLLALDENNNPKVVTLKVGDEKLDFQLALDKNDKLVDTTIDTSKGEAQIQNFDHFAKKAKSYIPSQITTEKSEYATYKVVADKNEDETLNASDLYDGFALTARGTEILADLKNAADKAEEEIESPTNALVQLAKTTGTVDANGYYKFTVTYKKVTGDKQSEVYKTITVRSTNENELKSLHKLLQKGTFNVGIVAGANRYETAVNVSKAAGTVLADAADTNKTNNIVLVNGEALVDGLAADTYAATVNGTGKQAAPILLSQVDSLPAATKDYLKELSSEIAAKNLNKVTVTLIGGHAVLSDEVVSELEDMGFSVKRIGGDNREETSVKVAEKMPASTTTFVVGGNGEADAMSISAVAADKKAPIIVSKTNTISSDALSYLEDEASTDTVRIIGGESVFSKESEEKVNKALAKTNAAYRISGKNRQATNAAVIKEYYSASSTDAEGIVLVKDGVAKKSELVDALSAANYAVKIKAPIVLGTSGITDEQKNNLLNIDMATAVPATKGIVAQVGEGANRTLLETIAGLFNISNK